MNAIMKDYYPVFRYYQALREQLLDLLNDDDLAFAVEGNEPLGELCREIGEVQHAYIESFKTLNIDFSYRNPQPELTSSVDALRDWYGQLDRRLEAVIEGFTDVQLAEIIVDRGGDFKVPLHIHLDIYKEALLIFYGKVRVYLRAMGKDLPEQWREWIG